MNFLNLPYLGNLLQDAIYFISHEESKILVSELILGRTRSHRRALIVQPYTHGNVYAFLGHGSIVK